ncbi:adenosine deaminase AGSA-like [Aricia agestis]|uniref:adenosine deaminase AGSA-like n=1 Tax=Aricia agestis TaxID=91739 RepID=UPI001C208817|nr:adenosine deaminase AGSA-like [Aricia agestis]
MRSVYLLLCIPAVCLASVREYSEERAKMVRNEARLSLGGRSELTDKESAVNDCLMRHKFREIDYGFDNPRYYNFSHHFFEYMRDIELSKVYRIIRDMPKGAALHVHDMGILGPDYVVNITYMDHLYVCFQDGDVKFKFSNKSPKDICANKWELMSNARKLSRNITEFDAKIRAYFTMYTDDPGAVYPTIKESWGVFLKYFGRILPLVTYRPVWEQYFYDVLKQFRSDNVMYVEVRSLLPNLYELDGTVFPMLVTAMAYKKAIHRFVRDYPDFYGAKLIFAPSRRIDIPKLEEYLQLARAIKEDMPEEFAGFDLVGQEDAGKPLIEFVPQLLEASKDLDYFFHAGETNWYGTLTDDNLYDAILLGTKRIGHAYALPKHPLLMDEVKKRGIGIEVNVISNAVLSLVRDVRNHPLSIFLARDLPVVLSSDDPGIWEADSLSDDFYVAFVGVANRLEDLRVLKQLALNSLMYSALSGAAKTEAIVKFNAQWDQFINNFDCSRY